MSPISRLVSAAAVVACTAGLGLAAEQTILGKSFVLKDAKPGIFPTERTVTVIAKEPTSSNTLVGDPTQMGSVGGAVLDLMASGAHPSSQSFVLAQGMSATGKPFWSGDATKGFKYKDAKGEQGPVKALFMKRSSKGTFSVKLTGGGKGSGLTVVPPNPGTDGCAAVKLGLTAGAGDRYSLQFGPESTIKNSGDRLFSAKGPMAEGICRPTNTSSTTTSTSPVTTTTIPIFCVNLFQPCGGCGHGICLDGVGGLVCVDQTSCMPQPLPGCGAGCPPGQVCAGTNPFGDSFQCCVPC